MQHKLTEVEAVIAALKVALQDAERRTSGYVKARAANRWIDHLPASRWGQWRRLKVRSDIEGDILRDDFTGQVRATIAYLEANKEVIANSSGASKSWLHFWRRKPKAPSANADPIDVEFSEAPKSGRKRKAPLKIVDQG